MHLSKEQIKRWSVNNIRFIVNILALIISAVFNNYNLISVLLIEWLVAKALKNYDFDKNQEYSDKFTIVFAILIVVAVIAGSNSVLKEVVGVLMQLMILGLVAIIVYMFEYGIKFAINYMKNLKLRDKIVVYGIIIYMIVIAVKFMVEYNDVLFQVSEQIVNIKNKMLK